VSECALKLRRLHRSSFPGVISIFSFLWRKFAILLIFLNKKGPKQHDQENLFLEFPKNSSHFEEESSYEIVKIF
jgi:hypothetical protein